MHEDRGPRPPRDDINSICALAVEAQSTEQSSWSVPARLVHRHCRHAGRKLRRRLVAVTPVGMGRLLESPMNLEGARRKQRRRV